MDLIPLTGSEKQVRWAEEIRTKQMAATLAELARQEERLANAQSEGNARAAARAEGAVANWRAILTAARKMHWSAWWIDRGQGSVQSLADALELHSLAYYLATKTAEYAHLTTDAEAEAVAREFRGEAIEDNAPAE
jgi:hypothetical protein